MPRFVRSAAIGVAAIGALSWVACGRVVPVSSVAHGVSAQAGRAAPSEWPRFRGADGMGDAGNAQLPVE